MCVGGEGSEVCVYILVWEWGSGWFYYIKVGCECDVKCEINTV